jgi:polyisoprenoid-binding protein YceI
VHEIFAQGAVEKTANGRSPVVEGSLTIAGGQVTAAEITADTTKLKSDEDRRDSAIANRGLETAKFPEATFKLTSPLALGSPAQGAETSLTAKGELTLHGQTKAVDVPLTAVWTGSEIKVATQGEGVPIAFADYGMSKIEIGGFVTTDDHGTLELQLLFVPA